MDLNCGSTLHMEFFIDHSVQTRAVTSAVGGGVRGGPTVVIRGFELHRRLAPQPPTLFKSHLYSRPLCPWVTPPALLLEDGLSLCNRFSSSQPPLVLRFGIQQAWLKAECFGKVPIGIQSMEYHKPRQLTQRLIHFLCGRFHTSRHVPFQAP